MSPDEAPVKGSYTSGGNITRISIKRASLTEERSRSRGASAKVFGLFPLRIRMQAFPSFLRPVAQCDVISMTLCGDIPVPSAVQMLLRRDP